MGGRTATERDGAGRGVWQWRGNGWQYPARDPSSKAGMPNNPPRRHHTVPRLYLQRFSAPSSGRRRLWVIDAESGHERPGSVSNETVRNDFYGPFESALAQRIDTGRIGRLFDRIEAGEALPLPRRRRQRFIFTSAFRRPERVRSVSTPTTCLSRTSRSTCAAMGSALTPRFCTHWPQGTSASRSGSCSRLPTLWLG